MRQSWAVRGVAIPHFAAFRICGIIVCQAGVSWLVAGFKMEIRRELGDLEEVMPEFHSSECCEVKGRGMVYLGGFPFTDRPPRDSNSVIGRTVRMDNRVFQIRGIERHMPATPYSFGEPVGLLFDWCVVADSPPPLWQGVSVRYPDGVESEGEFMQHDDGRYFNDYHLARDDEPVDWVHLTES